MERADVVVVGAGIAGASAAWALAGEADVIVLEAEPAAGLHATGRSAALLTETTGPEPVRALVRASRPFLEQPPSGFAAHPLTSPRGLLWVAPRSDEAMLRSRAGDMALLSFDEAAALVPALRPRAAAVAAYEPGAVDLDVDALLQGYLRGARERGARIRTTEPVTAIERAAGRWTVRSAGTTVEASVVVDAAGAWADHVAALAGVDPLGLRPLRRTAFTFNAPPGVPTERWPMVADVRERYYVKPDAGRLLGSPADEVACDPCDARALEEDVALAVDRIEEALDLRVTGVRAPWAGLRTFAADRVPVVGVDPAAPGFVWLAGQGGYGIKTSPALAWAVAAAVLDAAWPPALAAAGVTPDDLAPGRLQQLA